LIKNSLPEFRHTDSMGEAMRLTVSLLLDIGDIVLADGEVHGNGSRLDGNTSVDFILTKHE